MLMGGRGRDVLSARVGVALAVVATLLWWSMEVDANGGVISKAKDLARGKSDPTEKMFNVKEFKAKGNGKAEDTMAFMQAWVAACQWNGKAKLVIPHGKYLLGQTIFQGPCKGPGPMIVENQGTLLGVEDPSAFTSDEWILFEDITGLIIIGGGSFDGQGASVWEYSDCDTNENCQRMPVNVRFNRVKDAIIRRLSSVNAKGFHIALNFCDNIRLHNLKITAPDTSPNTDGIHISRSNMINIAKSDIGTGDDCVSMIQGCTNIRINKLKCGPGHGISVGSLGKYPDEIDVKGVIVKNCTFTNTDNGVRIKTWPDSPPSKASEIVFQDVLMNNVKNPIVIDQEYNYHGKSNIVPSRVKISDVRFINIKGTTRSKIPVNVVCSKQFPCDKLQFHNINLKYTGGAPGTSTCRNTKGVILGGIQIPPICK